MFIKKLILDTLRIISIFFFIENTNKNQLEFMFKILLE
jgi:hypothetical protein